MLIYFPTGPSNPIKLRPQIPPNKHGSPIGRVCVSVLPCIDSTLNPMLQPSPQKVAIDPHTHPTPVPPSPKRVGGVREPDGDGDVLVDVFAPRPAGTEASR